MDIQNILILLIIFFSLAHIFVDYKFKEFIFITKPVPMILIIILCITTEAKISNDFKYLILLGLIFSLTGDIFLMLKSDQFTKGLFSFLIAHLFYISAIIFTSGFHFSFLMFSISFIYLILIILVIVPKSESIKLYTVIYSFIIIFLLWQSYERMEYLDSAISTLFAAGIFLFTISDTILAYNKFVMRFPSAQLLILSTYFTAQTLIALSV